MKTRIISFANHKGGVGKTTTAASTGSILASKGYNVLLIDMDPQANLTFCMLAQATEKSIYSAMTGKTPTLPLVHIQEHLDLVPADLQLAVAEMELLTAIARERILSNLLQPIQDYYDFVLIDCPSNSLGLLVLNVLSASTDVIIPLIPEILSSQGLKDINEMIHKIRQTVNPDLKLTGFLLTKCKRNNLHRDIENELRDRVSDLLFVTKIRENITVAEMPLEGVNIVEFAPKSNGAKDYAAFTEELLQKIGFSDFSPSSGTN